MAGKKDKWYSPKQNNKLSGEIKFIYLIGNLHSTTSDRNWNVRDVK